MERAGSSGEQPHRARACSPDDPNPLLAKAYRNVGDIVDKARNGLIPDPTGGATHYYGRMPRPPKWAPPLAALNTVKIGNTTFVGGSTGPGQSLPSRFSGGRVQWLTSAISTRSLRSGSRSSATR